MQRKLEKLLKRNVIINAEENDRVFRLYSYNHESYRSFSLMALLIDLIKHFFKNLLWPHLVRRGRPDEQTRVVRFSIVR